MLIKSKKNNLIVTTLIVTFMTGCSLNTQKPLVTDKQLYSKTAPSTPLYASLPPEEGSLWTNSNAEMLFADKRARRAGDTVIIDIVENSSSNMAANTNTSGSSELTAGIPNMPAYDKIMQAFNANPTAGASSNIFNAATSKTFKGQGTSDRSGRVTASIGAKVLEVLPNGNLVISGKRETKINYETQFISVSGIVRPKDIDTNNRVKSTYITDASIEYSGKGVIAEKQKPGWMVRVLDHVWPF